MDLWIDSYSSHVDGSSYPQAVEQSLEAVLLHRSLKPGTILTDNRVVRLKGFKICRELDLEEQWPLEFRSKPNQLEYTGIQRHQEETYPGLGISSTRIFCF